MVPSVAETLEAFRETTRTHIAIPVRIRIAGQDDLTAVTANASCGGMFVKMTNPPPVGTLVRFEVDIGSPTIRGYAEIAWIRVRFGGSERPAGMGLQFRHFLWGNGEKILARSLPSDNVLAISPA